MMKMPPVQMDRFTLEGGLNLVSPPLAIPPGMCRDAQNYEIGIDGGYRRVQGYCRTDGTPLPSDAQYHVMACTITGTVVAGDTITGDTSAATGVVIAVEASALVFTKKVGTFTAEVLRVGGVVVATSSAASIQDGASTQALHGQYQALAADNYRADVQAVPGVGSILGVVIFAGTLYAFRNAVGGTAANLYRATASGWQLVTTPALLPDGSYEFVEYNFGSGLMLYGVDGVNKAFQFDGATFTQITTGMAADAPQCVAAHKNHLFLAFGHSLQHSATSNPLSYAPVLGAGELNMGDTITNLKPQPGSDSTGALAVYSRNSTRILYGTSSANWSLVVFDPNAGALRRTAQHMGRTFVVDDRGITTLETTQAYGNFAAASISATVRPMIVENKNRIVGTSISRDKNQYRVLFSNGRALYYTLGRGFMPMVFPDAMTCMFSGEDADGNEVIFAGGQSGYVYQLDRGSSFDGAAIDAFLVLVFNHMKSARIIKRYRKAVVEVGGDGYAEFWMSAELDYGDAEVRMQIPMAQLVAKMTAGRWDSGLWDAGVWDGRALSPSEFGLDGSGENISIRFAQSSNWQSPLTFYGVTTSYTPRRMMR